MFRMGRQGGIPLLFKRKLSIACGLSSCKEFQLSTV